MPSDDKEEFLKQSDQFMNGFATKIDPLAPVAHTIDEITDAALFGYDAITAADRIMVAIFLSIDSAGFAIEAMMPIMTDVEIGEAVPAIKETMKEAGAPDFDSAMLLIDCWGYPEDTYDLIKSSVDPSAAFKAIHDVMPPGEHPDRVNLSVVHIAHRAAHMESVSQTRGVAASRVWATDAGDSSGIDGVVIEGRIPDAVRELVS